MRKDDKLYVDDKKKKKKDRNLKLNELVCTLDCIAAIMSMNNKTIGIFCLLAMLVFTIVGLNTNNKYTIIISICGIIVVGIISCICIFIL